MITIDNTFKRDKPLIMPKEFHQDKLLFFDIETTGFSAEISSLYLIGCICYQNNTWQMTQWFADNYISEKEILIHFFEFIKSFDILIHYNGTGFDLPYLMKKVKKYNLPYNFTKIESFDLYKKTSLLKQFYILPNYKQKTVEQFLGLTREDPFTGGELIEVYNQYMQHKILSKPYKELLSALLLHNKEDLLGLIHCCDMLSYFNFFTGEFSVNSCCFKNDLLQIQLKLNSPLPLPLSAENESVSLTVRESLASLTINLYNGELKYFYPNYKDYFYLPKEDTAIHKSVAAYVDKDYREKAKASNCYTKKEGKFLIQYEEINSPAFLMAYKTRPYYFEWVESMLEDELFLNEYAKHIIANLCL